MGMSPEARAHKNEYRKELYVWYKERGLCVKCGHNYAEPGRIYCKVCGEKSRVAARKYDHATRSKQRRERLRAEGKCYSCGQRKAVPGRVLCAECARKNSESQQVRKMRKRLQREAEKGVREAGSINGRDAGNS